MDWDAFKALSGGVLAEPVAPGVVRLSEPGLRSGCRSFFYRIDTPDCAVLIDGGWGSPAAAPISASRRKSR